MHNRSTVSLRTSLLNVPRRRNEEAPTLLETAFVIFGGVTRVGAHAVYLHVGDYISLAEGVGVGGNPMVHDAVLKAKAVCGVMERGIKISDTPRTEAITQSLVPQRCLARFFFDTPGANSDASPMVCSTSTLQSWGYWSLGVFWRLCD